MDDDDLIFFCKIDSWPTRFKDSFPSVDAKIRIEEMHKTFPFRIYLEKEKNATCKRKNMHHIDIVICILYWILEMQINKLQQDSTQEIN